MTISARESGDNNKKSVSMVLINPGDKSIKALDKPSFIQVCKILDAGKVELFVEGKKVRNRKPEIISEIPDMVPDDIEDDF